MNHPIKNCKPDNSKQVYLLRKKNNNKTFRFRHLLLNLSG